MEPTTFDIIGALDVIGDFAIAAAGAALAVITAILANSYRRRMRLELAEARLQAYGRLHEITGLAAPTRLDLEGTKGALTRAEREALYSELTTWYYRDGNGLLLEGDTREIYLAAKRNLLCTDEQITPASAWSSIQADFSQSAAGEDSDVMRGIMSIRQLSLLRTQLKGDLAIFGIPFSGTLASHEREFLVGCGVDPKEPPWSLAPAQMSRVESATRLAGSDQKRILPDIRPYSEIAGRSKQ